MTRIDIGYHSVLHYAIARKDYIKIGTHGGNHYFSFATKQEYEDFRAALDRAAKDLGWLKEEPVETTCECGHGRLSHERGNIELGRCEVPPCSCKGMDELWRPRAGAIHGQVSGCRNCGHGLLAHGGDGCVYINCACRAYDARPVSGFGSAS